MTPADCGLPMSAAEVLRAEIEGKIEIARCELADAIRPVCREHTDKIVEAIDRLICAIADIP